jgi:cytochrome c-type biogenesis protein
VSLVVASVALAGAGLTSSLSPCVLPLLPGYIGALCDAGSGPKRPRVALFALGVASSFVALGAVVGALGFKIGSSGSAISRLAGVVLIVLSAGLVAGQVGWITFQFRAVRRFPAGGRWRSLALGVGCGAAWSPCVGPLLGAALTAAGGSGAAWRGSILLGAFALGILLPFFAVATLPLHRLGARVRRFGRALPWLAASVMLLVGIALAGGWYQQAIRHISV